MLVRSFQKMLRNLKFKFFQKFEIQMSLEAETSEMIILVMTRFGILLSSRFEF
jgi:hypothetical protein